MKKICIWRVFLLLLAATMLLSTISCNKKQETAENAEAEPNAQNLAQEQISPVELQMVSDFDADLDGKNDVYTFYNTLPNSFLLPTSVKIAGKDHLSTDVGVQSKTVENYTYYSLGLEYQPTDYEKVISWEFEVPNDGVYEFCFELYLEDGTPHGAVLEIDRNEIYYSLGYRFENGDEQKVWQDPATKNTYMCGLPTYFAAGKHVIEMRMDADYGDPLMLRNIYLGFGKNQTVALITLNEFSKTLPERFSGADAIKLDMDALDAGSSLKTETADSQYSLYTPNDTGAASANRVTKLLIDGLFHYYLNPSCAENKNTPYIRWAFSVPESGEYEVCFNFRLKDDSTRYAVFSLDGGDGQKMTYATGGKRDDLIDSVQNSYLTGWLIYLTKGDHTLTVTLPNNSGNSWHFRNIYLLKVAD